MSIIEFHSTADPMVPYSGGVDIKYVQQLTDFGPTPSTFGHWATDDHCNGFTIVRAGVGEQVQVWYGCRDRTLLEVWLRTTGGGHEWPTAPRAPVDASSTIARVISSQALVRTSGESSINPLAR